MKNLNLGDFTSYASVTELADLKEMTKNEKAHYLNNGTPYDTIQPQYYLVFKKKLPVISSSDIEFDLIDVPEEEQDSMMNSYV